MKFKKNETKSYTNSIKFLTNEMKFKKNEKESYTNSIKFLTNSITLKKIKWSFKKNSIKFFNKSIWLEPATLLIPSHQKKTAEARNHFFYSRPAGQHFGHKTNLSVP